ncbi:MAG: DUF1883 domain-containing protein [Hafnia sp.]
MSRKRIYLKAGWLLSITCSLPAMVMMMSDNGYTSYTLQKGAEFFGGYYHAYPALIEVPASQYWNVLLEARSFPFLRLNYSINIIKPAFEFTEVSPYRMAKIFLPTVQKAWLPDLLAFSSCKESFSWG